MNWFLCIYTNTLHANVFFLIKYFNINLRDFKRSIFTTHIVWYSSPYYYRNSIADYILESNTKNR